MSRKRNRQRHTLKNWLTRQSQKRKSQRKMKEAYLRNTKRLSSPKTEEKIRTRNALSFLQLKGISERKLDEIAQKNVNSIKLHFIRNNIKKGDWERLQAEQFKTMNDIFSGIGQLSVEREVPRPELLFYFGRWINSAESTRIIKKDDAKVLRNVLNTNITWKSRNK